MAKYFYINIDDNVLKLYEGLHLIHGEYDDSKYKLAICAAKRAKIIEEENWTSAENAICCKPVGQALEEILEGKTMMTFKKN